MQVAFPVADQFLSLLFPIRHGFSAKIMVVARLSFNISSNQSLRFSNG